MKVFDNQRVHVLITGANSGLGYATCCRLIDEFLSTKSSTSTLDLIITTRTTKKANDTLSSLTRRLHENPNNTQNAPRITFQSYQVDLLNLRSVLALASTLNTTVPRLDVLYLNAGIFALRGTRWPAAIWEATVDVIKATTYPSYIMQHVGTLAKPQLPPNTTTPEPPLGETFTANLFGHYLLTHALMPILTSTPRPYPARIVCIGSLEATAASFDISDLQGTRSSRVYHSSKRLTELLAFTAALPSAQKSISSFLSTPDGEPLPASRRPNFYVCHPGVCDTGIYPLFIIMFYLKLLSFYFARFIGSPWHTITAYKGAVAPVWLGLTPQVTLDGLEGADEKGKWGSSTDVWGREKVRRTEVEGWGFGGLVGAEGKFGGRAVRKFGVLDMTEEARKDFEELGGRAWNEMEELRVEWEKRLRNTW